MKYKISCSGGKDSVATVILWYLYHKDLIPETEVVFFEPMFDANTSGLLTAQYNHIYNKVITWCKEHGFTTTVLRSKKTYVEMFTHIVTRSKNPEKNGKMQGGLISGMCEMTGEKQRTLRKYKPDAIDIIGIAYDEPKRHDRMTDKQYSILYEHQFTESDAKIICEKFGLLSPHYERATRDGCWFCPNQFRYGIDTAEHKEMLKSLYYTYKDKLFTNKACYSLTFDDIFEPKEYNNENKV